MLGDGDPVRETFSLARSALGDEAANRRDDFGRRRVLKQQFAHAERFELRQIVVGNHAAADNEDVHALDFYAALGGEATPVTIYSFSKTSRG